VIVDVERQIVGRNDSAIQQCIRAARTGADLSRCIEAGSKGRGLTLRGGLEVMS